MDLNHPAINAMGQGWHLIEDELPSKQNRPKEPGALLLAKVKEHTTDNIVKKALELKLQQHPTADQVARQPSAVIVQGDQTLIKGNYRAKKFYEDIAEYIRHKGYSVQIVKETAPGEPPRANVVVSHGGLTPRKGTKILNIPQYPSPFITKSLLGALDRLVAKK
jgi:hypothetical protein